MNIITFSKEVVESIFFPIYLTRFSRFLMQWKREREWEEREKDTYVTIHENIESPMNGGRFVNATLFELIRIFPRNFRRKSGYTDSIKCMTPKWRLQAKMSIWNTLSKYVFNLNALSIILKDSYCLMSWFQERPQSDFTTFLKTIFNKVELGLDIGRRGGS